MSSLMKWLAACLVIAAAAITAAMTDDLSASPQSRRGATSQSTPALGAKLTPLPDGTGKTIAEGRCLACHSSDLIRQQRLTRQQWTASVTKMIGWGADVPDAEKEALIEYLSTHFGPDNTSFTPVVARPVRR